VARDTRQRFTYFSVLMPLANPSGPTSWTFVDGLGLRGHELRVLLAQFGPKARFWDLRFKCEA
jgi:hypothetical protein